jgi:hypothetical protein
VVDAGSILDSPPLYGTSPMLIFPYRHHLPFLRRHKHYLRPKADKPIDHCDWPPFPSLESDSEDLPLSDEVDLGSVIDSEVLSDEFDPGGALEPLPSPLSLEWSTKISNLASTSDESDSLSEPSSLTFGNERRPMLGMFYCR